MDERDVKKARGPSKNTVEAIDKGERVQTVKMDEYARAIRYPIATIFDAACRKLTPAALLLAERIDGLSPEVKNALLTVVETAIRSRSQAS